MFLERIYWEDGLRLDKDILDQSNLTILERSRTANYLPANLNKGIISFDLDIESLQTGLILIKELELYLDEKTFIFFDKSYPLSIQVMTDELAGDVPLFLNVKEKIVEKEGVKYIYNQLSLSLEHDYSVKYSTQIALFKLDRGRLVSDIYDFPLLTLNHYMMQDAFIKLSRIVSELKSFNRFVFSTSRSYAAILLVFLINKIERELKFAESNRLNSSPKQLFDLVHDIYSLIQLNLDKHEEIDNIEFDFYKPLKKLNLLSDRLLTLCEYRKISNFIKFDLQGRKYLCENFPEEFFVATRYYVLIKRRTTAPANVKFENKKLLRITSISRNKNVVTLSLSGVKLVEVEHSMMNFTTRIDNIDAIYEIQKGSEWDFILADSSAVFTAFEGSENFDFFIAFT
ncbi:intracellular growth locus [Francisella philomiragia]|uniref:Intracellular growth locus protein D n=1 Tax=Francisella philomiragia TaxID=28110 RepID=A0AAW3D712_9GAMM|nr:type VI secretion system baseplate subunit TssK [Francisella philomiragia]KFJ41876.1 putative intracellular growth locus protein D [Francisella philomiragia]MBK2255197.1 intracellular growth locus [Francisella philomiragia]MBK2268242.1 intracellular growth locus [Francisella philomiragia]MBK2273426.1 intracellular growth locus [Francisella philomiragia]MBK2277495.1 intracellular growth locus [Francisella philomiragia]